MVVSLSCCFSGKLGPVWRQLQSVVPPDLCRTVGRAGREGGLYLHKLHTARLRPRKMKTKKWLFEGSAVLLPAAALNVHTWTLCALWLLPFTFWLALSDHGAIHCFFQLQKTVTVFRHMAGFSANQLILSESFQDLMQMYKMAKRFKNQQRRDFSTKNRKVNLTSHFRTAFFFFFFTCIWTMWNLSFSCRVNIIYLSNNWTD